MKTISLIIICLILLGGNLFAGDTGTYKIEEYKVRLTPYSNGTVEIEYYQKWLVTGGHIPWITIGTPNSNFEFTQKKSGNIKSIVAQSQGSWSGVKIELDKDYKPNESFEVGFSIIQRKLFYADNENYKMDFIPGWYDNAETSKLNIEIIFFAKLDTVKTEPKPTRVQDQSIFWEMTNLPKGKKVCVSFWFPKKLLPKPMDDKELKSEFPAWAIVLIGLIAGILIALVIALASSDGGYGGGGIIFGGGGRSSSSGGGGLFSGGGGGFGGRSSSCACACVSCACACACAGGGGAGCDRKLMWSCAKCDKKDTCSLRRDC